MPLGSPLTVPYTGPARAWPSLAVHWLGALLLAMLAPFAVVAAPAGGAGLERVELIGAWRPLAAASARDAAPSWQRFDPQRLQRFGRAPAGAEVLLFPGAGAWPDGPLVLTVATPGLQRLTLQLPDAPPQSAHILAAGERAGAGAGGLVFEVATPPRNGAPLRLHVDTRGAVPSPMTFALRGAAAHARAEARWLALATACLATMLVTAAIALFFGLRLRDAAFGYYAVYVAAYALIQAVQIGYVANPLGWEALASTTPLWVRPVTALSMIAAVLFLDRFAELQQWLPRVRRWLWGYCALMALLVAVGYVPALRSVALVTPMMALGVPLILVVAVTAAWRGSRYAALFLLGWVPLMGFFIAYSLQLYGLLPGWTWTGTAALATGAFEAVVLSLGLAERAAAVRQQRDQARLLAELDPLTGVLNRRAWREHMHALIAARADRGLTVLFLDIDHFKWVNDRLGHEGGDRVLQVFVEVLRQALREQDLVGRYGGEEFVVGLMATDTSGACAIADRIRSGLRARSETVGAGMPLTVSIGVATLGPREQLDDVLRRADGALYAAKDAGRDRVVVASTRRIATLPVRAKRRRRTATPPRA
ncbi:MAG TPA: diguanylate cyclase [Lysobacter sp.]|nr:diguanylate cyclase [Lysobacter sp.]